MWAVQAIIKVMSDVDVQNDICSLRTTRHDRKNRRLMLAMNGVSRVYFRNEIKIYHSNLCFVYQDIFVIRR